MRIQGSMSLKMYTLTNLWKKNFSGQKFLPFWYPFEIKKGLNLGKISEIILQMAILGEKQKTFFFWKLYQNAKNPVAFDFWSKDFLGHKLSFFSKQYPFFCPFWPQIQKPSYKWPFWVKNRKTFFLKTLSKC
jgi:hypothetical protein